MPREDVLRTFFGVDKLADMDGYEWLGLMWYGGTDIDVYSNDAGTHFKWVWVDGRGCKMTHDQELDYDKLEDWDGPHYDTLKVKLTISQC